ncbi:hypothetical protein [Paenibacillus periandrae]|uniref:hypothetical protein n=1 Tax=Paenibacillus periandrae TaxID=1761741 RepID=UPI001F09BC20|nr:hypothetical protein [Paenibacillus periandrae]
MEEEVILQELKECTRMFHEQITQDAIRLLMNDNLGLLGLYITNHEGNERIELSPILIAEEATYLNIYPIKYAIIISCHELGHAKDAKFKYREMEAFRLKNVDTLQAKKRIIKLKIQNEIAAWKMAHTFCPYQEELKYAARLHLKQCIRDWLLKGKSPWL